MKNIVDLRNKLGETFEDLRAGKIEPKVAKELNNSAGKIIATVKAQLEYQQMLKSTTTIKFMSE